MNPEPIFSAPDSSIARICTALLSRDGATYGGSIRRNTGGRFTCPVHEDERPSLDVQEGADVPVVVNCKVCESVYTPDEFLALVASALQLPSLWFSMEVGEPGEVDWGAPAQSLNRGTRKKDGRAFHFKVKHEYNYRTRAGEDAVRIFRAEDVLHQGPGKPDKTFWAKHWTESDGWLPGIGPNERTPYLLERFEKWRDAGDDLPGRALHLCEGEEAVKAVVRAGGAATTFFGGASGVLEADWAGRWFRGFPLVRVVADRDAAGVRRARELVRELKAAGVRCEAVVSATTSRKDDAVEHLSAGFDLSSWVPLSRELAASLSASEPSSGAVPGAGGAVASGGLSGAPVGPRRAELPPLLWWPAPGQVVEVGRAYRRERWERAGSALVRWRGDHYFWDEAANCYVPFDREFLTHDLYNVLHARPYKQEGEVRNYNAEDRWINKVENALLIDGFRDAETEALGEHISFRNGHLRLSDLEFLPKSPDVFNLAALPFDYSASKKRAKRWIRFLKSCGIKEGSPEYRLLQQWFGYCLSGMTKYQKMLLIEGASRSGKGVIVRVLQALLGSRGYTALNFRALSTNFGLQSAIGKQLAVFPDARFKLRADEMSTAVERLLSISGEDAIQIDRKNRDPWVGKLGARVMITTNEVPRMIESSNALANRFVSLHMGVSFLGREDLELESKLAEEYDAILQWSLDGLLDLTANGGFAQTQATLDVRDEMLRSGSSVRAFSEECLVVKEKAEVLCEELYANYKLWCNNMGLFSVDFRQFFKELNQIFPEITMFRRQTGGRRLRGYRGIDHVA